MRAELFKIRTVPAGRALVAILVLGGALLLVVSALAPALISALIDVQRHNPDLRLTDADSGRFDGLLSILRLQDHDYQLSLVDIVSTGPFSGAGGIALTATSAALVGVLVATTDVRHGGIVPAALATPHRLRLVASKAAAAATLTAGAALVLVVTSAVVLALAVLVSPDVALRISLTQAGLVWTRGLLVLVLLALIGLGLGLVVRHQTAAVVVVLVVAVLEPMLALIVRLVSGTSSAVLAALPVSASHLAPRGTTLGAAADLAHTLAPHLAILALAAWAVLVLAAGTWRTHRRDIA